MTEGWKRFQVIGSKCQFIVEKKEEMKSFGDERRMKGKTKLH